MLINSETLPYVAVGGGTPQLHDMHVCNTNANMVTPAYYG
jgi:hypothetical protein